MHLHNVRDKAIKIGRSPKKAFVTKMYQVHIIQVNNYVDQSPTGRVRRVLSQAGETRYKGFRRLESFTS